MISCSVIALNASKTHVAVSSRERDGDRPTFPFFPHQIMFYPLCIALLQRGFECPIDLFFITCLNVWCTIRGTDVKPQVGILKSKKKRQVLLGLGHRRCLDKGGGGGCKQGHTNANPTDTGQHPHPLVSLGPQLAPKGNSSRNNPWPNRPQFHPPCHTTTILFTIIHSTTITTISRSKNTCCLHSFPPLYMPNHAQPCYHVALQLPHLNTTSNYHVG